MDDCVRCVFVEREASGCVWVEELIAACDFGWGVLREKKDVAEDRVDSRSRSREHK